MVRWLLMTGVAVLLVGSGFWAGWQVKAKYFTPKVAKILSREAYHLRELNNNQMELYGLVKNVDMDGLIIDYGGESQLKIRVTPQTEYYYVAGGGEQVPQRIRNTSDYLRSGIEANLIFPNVVPYTAYSVLLIDKK